MLLTFLTFLISLYLVIRGATWATRYAARLAHGLHFSPYAVGFIIVALISVLPETFVSISSIIQEMPSFGLGTLFGSNVADLTLIIAIIIFYAGRGIKIESKILSTNRLYSFLLFIPLLLGLNGYYSRLEGAVLVIVGIVFYYMAFRREEREIPKESLVKGHHYKNIGLFLISIAALLIGSHFTVMSAAKLAADAHINPMLIGMFVVGLGTTLPELFFALKSVKRGNDSLAVGDILGTVLTDATIVIGTMALIHPFSFSPAIIYVTGAFMVSASFLLFKFMYSGKIISKKEAFLLLSFWILFVFVECMVSK